MGWIEERVTAREKLFADQELIRESSKTIWDAFWKETMRCIEDFRAKYGTHSVLTNGTQDERKVILSKHTAGGHLVEALRHITIQRSGDSISSGGVRLQMRVCKDGVVCLTHDENELSIEDAVRMILDPFFFPELQ